MKPTITGKALFVFTLFLAATHTFSQTNTFPTTGNVRIGTGTAPTSKLQVNEPARIDDLEGNLKLNSLRNSTLLQVKP